MPIEVPAVVTAVIGSVCGSAHQRFAVAFPQSPEPPFTPKTSITFSLSDWKGRTAPRRGEIVELSDIRLFIKGWRALAAKPQAESNSKKKKGDLS